MSEATMQQLAAAFRKADRAATAYQEMHGWVEDTEATIASPFPILEWTAKSPLTGETIKLAVDLDDVIGVLGQQQRAALLAPALNKQAKDYIECLEELATIAMSLTEQAKKASTLGVSTPATATK